MNHVGKTAPWDENVKIIKFTEMWPEWNSDSYYMWCAWEYSDGWEHWERRRLTFKS